MSATARSNLEELSSVNPAEAAETQLLEPSQVAFWELQQQEAGVAGWAGFSTQGFSLGAWVS